MTATVRTLRPYVPSALRRAPRSARLAARRRNAASRPLPEFLVLGAQKAGTSTLYAQLVAHPRVLPALAKEVHCFDTPRALDERWYRAHFPTVAQRAAAAGSEGPVVSGESTPFYLAHRFAPERAAAVVPDARLLIVLRDPVQRAVSAYHHARRWRLEQRPIEVALDPHAAEIPPPDAGPEWWDAPECPIRRNGYLPRGRYAEQLEWWRERFAPDRFLVLDLSELDTGNAARRSFELLGLPPVPVTAAANRNVGRYPAADRELLDRLRAYFAPHNERLSELLGRRFTW